MEKIMVKKDMAEVYKLKVLDGYAPCDGDGDYKYCEWFKVNNAEELALFNEAFETDAKCDSFPEFICIDADEDYGCCYSQTAAACIEYVEELLGKLGYDVVITLRKES